MAIRTQLPYLRQLYHVGYRARFFHGGEWPGEELRLNEQSRCGEIAFRLGHGEGESVEEGEAVAEEGRAKGAAVAY